MFEDDFYYIEAVFKNNTNAAWRRFDCYKDAFVYFDFATSPICEFAIVRLYEGKKLKMLHVNYDNIDINKL